MSGVYKSFTALAIGLLTTAVAMAHGGGSAPKESSIYDPFVLVLLIVMCILLLAIGLLANVVLGAASYYHKKEKEQAQQQSGGTTTAILSVIVLLLLSAPSFAQDNAGAATAAVQTTSPFGSLSATTFYFMVGVIGLELLVVFVLLYQLRVFIIKEKAKQQPAVAAEQKTKPVINIWHKLNKFRPVEQEADLDLGHDYDGIRELDNRLPPWWLYGFYVSILFAVVYLWRYHVSHSAPLPQEELQIAMTQAEEQKAQYLKNAANNVDETTVKLLTATSDIESGHAVFTQNCSPCHGKAGEGIVGPNLTDDYWLHGGGIKDLFKTIKYGWPEKGMRSWKDDLSPVQIAQVASFIKSIHGTNPPNAKPKQGELYQEAAGGATTDSLAVKATSVTKK